MSTNHIEQFGHYMKVSGRVRGSINLAAFLATTCTEIAELEPAVEPEIIVALEHVREAIEALGRADAFVATRLEVALDG